MDHFYTIEKTGVAEFKDRGSRFLAYAYPLNSIDEFKTYMQVLKAEHPKAVHYCFAYRLGTDGNLFRVSDDGEPSGSAGRPILGQIDSKQLTNILVVVVRYFGGTLLGVPGLIHAYKTATSLVLQTIPIVQKPITVPYAIHFDYTRLNEVMHIIKQYNCEVTAKDIQLFCHYHVAIPRNRLEEVLFKLQEMQGVEVRPATVR